MKAIRSLEQHVDSLMSYDFIELSDMDLMEELEIIDDRRLWRIAEAIRRSYTYQQIHDITKIDFWFIDKIAILVGMEYALKTRKLTPELLKEAKRMVESEIGEELFSHRGNKCESPNGFIKYNLNSKKFKMKGLARNNTNIKICTMLYNLTRLISIKTPQKDGAFQ